MHHIFHYFFQQFYFPDHVGYPLGGNEKPTFVRMETHYDNPDRNACEICVLWNICMIKCLAYHVMLQYKLELNRTHKITE